MQTIVFTTCSVSHLAQAKSLCNSVLRYNPAYRCFIGVIDKVEGRVDAKIVSPHTIIEGHTIGVPQFEAMTQRYNALELSCAMKSFFAGHLFNMVQPQQVLYFDSDILIFHSLENIEAALQSCSVLLTPHITQPYPLDGLRPQEKDILKTGLYNAGFFALCHDQNSIAFLNWWKARMVDQCYEKPKEGLNVDQNWLNFLPLFFDGVKILDDPGCNVAYWNLHERTISKRENRYWVNENVPLRFFHFSGYNVAQPQTISRHQDRIDLKREPTVEELVQLYHDTLSENEVQKLVIKENVYNKFSFSKKLMKLIKIKQ